jgi:hypothetical protein
MFTIDFDFNPLSAPDQKVELSNTLGVSQVVMDTSVEYFMVHLQEFFDRYEGDIQSDGNVKKEKTYKVKELKAKIFFNLH